MSNLSLRGLYAITRDESDTTRLLNDVTAALRGGASAVQYRNKAASPALAAAQAAALRELMRDTPAPLIINDDIELAIAVGADGVQLGRDDHRAQDAHEKFAAIRKRAGAQRLNVPFLIGVSCYNELNRARDAVTAGASYVAFGSVFSSSTKPSAGRASLGLISEAKRELDTTVVAIGGITVENTPQLIAAGADAVAVISDIFDAPDIRLRAQQYSTLFSSRT